jgi:RNA polymerase sigma-70 factor, ECF subfamily
MPATELQNTEAADRDRFEDLWRRHHTPLRRWLSRATGDRQLADDLAAEVFLRVWQYRHTLRPDVGLTGARSWVFTIARNVLIAHQRSAYAQRVEPADTLPDPGSTVPVASAEDTVVAADQSARLADAVRRAIEDLPDPQCVVLRGDLAGRSVREIAAAMGRTPGSVHVLRRRGRDAVGRLVGSAAGRNILDAAVSA